MRINDDLTKPIIVDATKLDWVASPAVGVDRRMLYRVGDEVARATSIVRYAAGSAFPRHTHRGGEEILVLDGTFQDEHGDYPAGSYFRNPPGTSHVPAAKDGCIIFVRLWQYRDGDQTQIVRQPGEGDVVEPRKGASAATILFDDGHEVVRLEEWMAGEIIIVANPQGLELLVLSGTFTANGMTLNAQSWGRLPANVDLSALAGSEGACVWIKEAPLLHDAVL
ncbi:MULTISPECIES: cupin domain-containing protein [Hyphomicrobiales]|uniref:Cupin n=3 Tax=Hyphomicrobiales TaxID=356 RepID=A0A6L3Y8P2_9HYPH|nr:MULTISPECIES: cupin domain-containing protein [Hyphomicrobiales]KAB2674085.1 cupin [Brucella tritici]MBO0130481.1 cupin domain-containing protein [Agrobacterium burrii]